MAGATTDKPKQPKKSKKSRKAKRIASAIRFFDEQYGKDANRLAGWQALCADVGVPVGKSITQCRKYLEDVFVNIFDYVEDKRNGSDIFRFSNLEELQNYSFANYKLFPLGKARRNPMLEGLLVKMTGDKRI